MRARSASAEASSSGAPKARASRFCQPRGRPSAASTASNTDWSPSVTVSATPGSVSDSSACASAIERASAARDRRVAEILDAGLEELVAALAALAKHLAEIGVAARRAGLGADVVEADGNGEFRPQAERLARLALGEKDAAAQILARHVEKRIGRLQHGDLDAVGAARRRRVLRCRRRWRGGSWR